MAINAPRKGKGFVVSYHPAKADEASTTLNGLCLLADYGDAVLISFILQYARNFSLSLCLYGGLTKK
jgi:hypothetical protein